MARGLMHYEKLRGGLVGSKPFARAAVKLRKKVRGKVKAGVAAGKAAGKAGRAAWIKENYGAALTEREMQNAIKAYFKMMSAKGGVKAKGRKPRKKKATYKSAKF